MTMKLTGKTTTAIRNAVRCRVVELPEHDGQLNALLWDEESDVGDWHPMEAWMVVEDVVGLIELDLYLYSSRHSLRGNKTVWVFDDGREQHVITDERKVPSEFERGIRIAAAN